MYCIRVARCPSVRLSFSVLYSVAFAFPRRKRIAKMDSKLLDRLLYSQSRFQFLVVTCYAQCTLTLLLPGLVVASHLRFPLHLFVLAPLCGDASRSSENNFQCYDGVTVGLTGCAIRGVTEYAGLFLGCFPA